LPAGGERYLHFQNHQETTVQMGHILIVIAQAEQQVCSLFLPLFYFMFLLFSSMKEKVTNF
jgi:hypothetical protein